MHIENSKSLSTLIFRQVSVLGICGQWRAIPVGGVIVKQIVDVTNFSASIVNLGRN